MKSQPPPSASSTTLHHAKKLAATTVRTRLKESSTRPASDHESQQMTVGKPISPA